MTTLIVAAILFYLEPAGCRDSLYLEHRHPRKHVHGDNSHRILLNAIVDRDPERYARYFGGEAEQRV